jgi:hypothetical protein
MVIRDNELAIHAYIPAIAYFPKALPATVWVLSFSSLFGYQYTVAVVMANDAHYGSSMRIRLRVLRRLAGLGRNPRLEEEYLWLQEALGLVGLRG